MNVWPACGWRTTLVAPTASSSAQAPAIDKIDSQGFVFNRAALGAGVFDCWQHLVPYLLAKGHAPALVERSAWRISFSVAAHWRMSDADFALRKRTERDLGETAVISHDDSEVFLVLPER